MPALAKVFWNGSLIAYEDAKIHIDTPACKSGAAVFEGLRGYWNPEQSQMYVFRLGDHSERLMRSIKLMRFSPQYTIDYAISAVATLLGDLKPQVDLHIRQTVWLDGAGAATADAPIGMAVVATPTGRPAGFDTGINCQISSWMRISDQSMPPRIKCVANYHNGRLATMQARLDGYDNALLLNSQGKVAEGPGACFFFVKNGVIVTPTVTSDILESINRATTIQLAKECLCLDVEVREVDRTEVYTADEAFLCGTAAEITPIASIDRFPMKKSPGDITRKLQENLIGIARGAIADHPEWRTRV